MELLEALNWLLSEIGSRPVNDVNNPLPTVANAKRLLERKTHSIQRTGWWFNIEYNVEFTRQGNNEILIADDIAQYKGLDRFVNIRGGKLFNRYTGSYEFEADECAQQIVRILPWESLPYVAQEHIMYVSALEFVRQEIDEPGRTQELGTHAGETYLEMKKENLEQSRLNAFNSQQAFRARGGVRPYHGRNGNRAILSTTALQVP